MGREFRRGIHDKSVTALAVVSRAPLKFDVGYRFFIFSIGEFLLTNVMGIIRALVAVSRVSECSTSGVQERKRASDAVMLELKGALGPEWLVTLGVESSIWGHLQRLMPGKGIAVSAKGVYI